MLTYKKAVNLLENSKVEFNLEYSKTTDLKNAMSRKQGSRHPMLNSIVFRNLDENGTYAYIYVLGVITGTNDIEDLVVDWTYKKELVDEEGKFDSWLSDIESAIKLLLPEILENYMEEDTEE